MGSTLLLYIVGIGSPKRQKYDSMGEAGLCHGMTQAQLKEIRRLEKENALLKQIIAEKELESKLKDELLEKQYPLSGPPRGRRKKS